MRNALRGCILYPTITYVPFNCTKDAEHCNISLTVSQVQLCENPQQPTSIKYSLVSLYNVITITLMSQDSQKVLSRRRLNRFKNNKMKLFFAFAVYLFIFC